MEEEEIETVGGEIMENENPKLHRPTPKDKYVVEPEIVDENSQEDEEKLYENLKFKFNVDLDDEDIHNVASNIVANAFEEVISDVNNEKTVKQISLMKIIIKIMMMKINMLNKMTIFHRKHQLHLHQLIKMVIIRE